MTDAGSPVTPPNDPESVHQDGFDLGGPPQAGKHFRVLAPKYPPSRFDDLIGQDAGVRTVTTAFAPGRIPQAITDGSLEMRAGISIAPHDSQFALCGNPAMVEDVTQCLIGRGLKKHRRRDPGQITTETYW